ncbi:MAG: hypothetical protein Q9186_001184 [Xanthomendoza sp. 1 TL-2023]
MATNAAKGAAKQLQSGRTSTAYLKKYTVHTTGIWDRIRRALAVDPNRSSGVPLNPQYRNPPPGANPPGAYDDPVTVPAGDIAENAYFRRDIRRSYPRLSVVKQKDVVGLLTVGSKAKPKDDVLQIGDAGAKQLIQVQQEGEEKGLAALFQREKTSVASILGPTGLPPFPTGGNRTSPEGGRKYIMDADREEGYPEDYPCRTFVTVRPSMAEDAARQPRPETIDFILSCSICQDTLSAVYATQDKNDGLRRSTDNGDGAIIKLWLTECAHITCAKHLEGGGEPASARFSSSSLLTRSKVCPSTPRTSLRRHHARYVSATTRITPTRYSMLLEERSRANTTTGYRRITSKFLPYSWVVQATKHFGALRQARDQLYGFRGDVSFIDNALQLAASLRMDGAVPGRRPIDSIGEGLSMPSANVDIPAGSLLACGSAVDLKSIQNGVEIPDDWDSPLTAGAAPYNNGSLPKRRRLGPTDNYGTGQQHGSDTCSLQQRLASRDMMPPPSGRLLKKPQPNASRPWSSSRSQNSDHASWEALNGCGQPSCYSKSYDEEQNISHISSPSIGASFTGPKPRLASMTRGIGPNLSRFVYDQQDINPSLSRTIYDQRDNDGELDKALLSSSHRSHPSSLSTNRLTLPPSTPSVVSCNTPRRSVGMSANIRTSQPSYLTPKSTSSLQARVSHRNPIQYNQPMASPHFRNRTLASFNTTHRPYTKESAFSQDPSSDPRLDMPMFGSTNSAPRQFSWLNAPLPGQVQRQNQRGTNNKDEVQSGSGAYRRPGARQSMDQGLSLNSFSFTSHPQIGDGTVERRFGNSFINHGRRAAHR